MAESNDISTILNNAENLIQKKIGKKKDKMWNYFHIIDIPNNPHKDFVKSLYFNYELPRRTTLSTTYLNEEAANKLLKIKGELHQSKNLTLD
ncbi:ribonuclease H-like domain-containing protein [Rhizophagus irregularis DAOM 181602=DAOM 197198]|nr:ribonuclease H-like domain-containing protein [Rhizophagus irregularis DAOM 181602=DAOM 197198]